MAEARLREWAPREPREKAADLLAEHQYYLAPLLPPATFLSDPSTAPEGLLRLRGIRSVLHAAGRHLGGTDCTNAARSRSIDLRLSASLLLPGPPDERALVAALRRL